MIAIERAGLALAVLARHIELTTRSCSTSHGAHVYCNPTGTYNRFIRCSYPLKKRMLFRYLGEMHTAYFWYFWLTIQNTANRHISNAFDLLGVFISFSLARKRNGLKAGVYAFHFFKYFL